MMDKNLSLTQSNNQLTEIFRMAESFAKGESQDKLYAAVGFKFLITTGRRIIKDLETWNQEVIETLQLDDVSPEAAREIFDSEWSWIDYKGFKQTEEFLLKLIEEL